MAGTRRPGFSDFEKAEIWRGWKNGKTLNSIGRTLDRAGPHLIDSRATPFVCMTPSRTSISSRSRPPRGSTARSTRFCGG